MGSRNGDMTKLVKLAVKNGCNVYRMGNGHIMIEKDGQRSTVPASPSSVYAMKRMTDRLRKRGLIP